MKPQFLCIGAQRAGTTWLYRNLSEHPDIWTPPQKEIHYFGAASRHPLALLALVPGRRNDRSRLLLARIARSIATREGTASLAWNLRYALSPRSEAWYESLFRPGPGQICGEISPEYARLGGESIERVRAIAPELRIIYLVRDPVERAWSQAAKYFSTRVAGGLDRAPRPAVEAFLARRETLRHSRYAANLDAWERHFPANQIRVFFFDEIAENPTRLLSSVHRFLGVEVDERHVPASATVKFSAQSYAPIERRLAATLGSALIDDATRLHAKLNTRRTERWLESVVAHASRAPTRPVRSAAR